MSESGIQTLARAWVRITEEVKFPSGYDGTASLEAHRAIEAMQEQIREQIVTTGDMRLFSLLQLLGQASLCMDRQSGKQTVLIGYARVSTQDQNPELQRDALNQGWMTEDL